MAKFVHGYWTEHDLAGEGFRRLGRNVRIAPTCTVVGAASISLGDDVRIDGYCTLVAAGATGIQIGANVHLGGYCALLGAEGITMADFSTLSWGVKVFTRSDDFSGQFMTNPTVPEPFTRATKAPVRIGRHCVVGSGCVVLPGASIGDGCAVGALSLVRGELAPWTVQGGVPARVLRERRRDLLELERQLLEQRARDHAGGTEP